MWVAVGGSPESAVRAGTLGLPMALAIIGGLPERFVPFAELHRRAARGGRARAPAAQHQLARLHRRDVAAGARRVVSVRRRDDGPDRSRARLAAARAAPHYDAAATLRGANFVGTPEQIVEKILYQHGLFGHERFLVQFSVGTMPHAQIMRSIELFGTEVAPAVRRELTAVPA